MPKLHHNDVVFSIPYNTYLWLAFSLAVACLDPFGSNYRPLNLKREKTLRYYALVAGCYKKA